MSFNRSQQISKNDEKHNYIIFGDLPSSHPPHKVTEGPHRMPAAWITARASSEVPSAWSQRRHANPCDARGVSHPWGAWVDQHWAPAKHLELHPTDEPARPNSWLLHGVHGGVWNPKQLGACKSLWRTTITWLQHYEACDAAANRLWCKRASAAVGNDWIAGLSSVKVNVILTPNIAEPSEKLTICTCMIDMPLNASA